MSYKCHVVTVNQIFVIDQDALYPLLSLMDHEDIGVVSSFGLVIFKIRI